MGDEWERNRNGRPVEHPVHGEFVLTRTVYSKLPYSQNVCSLFGRLPKAKFLRRTSMHVLMPCSPSSKDISYVAAACFEMGVPGPDSTLVTPCLKTKSQKDKRAYVVDLAIKLVDKYTIIPDAILHKKIPETHDAVHNYS